MTQFWDGPENIGWQSLAARLEEQTRFFWAIDSIAGAVNSTVTTEEILRNSLERVIEATDAMSGSIYVMQPGGSWVRAVGSGAVEDLDGGLIVAGPDDPAINLILQANGPVSKSERLNEPAHFISASAKRSGVQSWAAVPVTALDTTWGVMMLLSRSYDSFTGVQLALLRVTGQLLGVSLSNTAIRERALLQAGAEYERQVAEMEAMLAGLPDGLVICSNAGVIVRANMSAVQILGVSSEQLVGSSVLTERWNNVVAAPEDTAGTGSSEWPLRSVIEEGQDRRNAYIRWPVQGQPHTLSLTASPIQRPGGKREGAVIVVRDMTEERKAEQMKDEFLSLLSHELRGPLTVVSGYAQMLTRRLKRLDLSEEVNYAALIKENAIRMSGMVGDLVDSGRLESGIQAIGKEQTDLGALATRVAARIGTEQSYAASFHSIDVDVEDDLPPVGLDPRRIDQVLTNLITNAIKYSPDGGPIQIRVGRTQPDKSTIPARELARNEAAPPSLTVSVSDRGAGVPLNERRHIFERSYRGELGKSISAQGLGLGLYISRLAVEAHGGHIGVEDGPDGLGSTFWFSLPLEQS